MESQKESFIEGAQKNKKSKRVAEDLWDQIETFAGYGFNKSHSAAYALISYQTAWLSLITHLNLWHLLYLLN